MLSKHFDAPLILSSITFGKQSQDKLNHALCPSLEWWTQISNTLYRKKGNWGNSGGGEGSIFKKLFYYILLLVNLPIPMNKRYFLSSCFYLYSISKRVEHGPVLNWALQGNNTIDQRNPHKTRQSNLWNGTTNPWVMNRTQTGWHD